MQQQAVFREWLSAAGSLRCAQRTPPIPELKVDVSTTIALICHDLRLPLTAILANAEFLTQPDISEKEKNELYEEIRWSIEQMSELVTSLFDCSRLRNSVRPGVHSIVDTVERAIRLTRVRREFRRITIRHHHHGQAVGWFDCDRIERVVANLVVNACEAVSPDTGLIVITTTGNRDYLQMAIWDNGPGISPTIQESVFRPFVTYGKVDGSGLGLAIAKKIVEDHGGEIYVDGRNRAGALFRITIPFAIPREQTRTCLQVPSTPRARK